MADFCTRENIQDCQTLDCQNSNLAGIEHQLHQLRHEGISKSEGLQVWVHQRGEQHRQQVPKHSGLSNLFQTFQP